MAELGDDNSTIFSGDLDPSERAAVKSGEKRGERVAMQENPERFGLAGERARNRKAYAKNYAKIDWSIK